VTGGGSRLGLAIVRGLIEAGYDVAAHYHSSEKGLAELERENLGSASRLIAVQADFSDRRGPAELASRAREALGRLDLLVNNAAIMLPDDADVLDLATMKLINVDAPASLVEALTDALAENGGSIVNIADVAALQPFRKHLSYSRSKAVLVSRTRQWAHSLAKWGVRANAVCPGTVLPADSYRGSRLEALRRAIPLGRLGDPSDVVSAVLFFASASFVTGQVLSVDGGRSLVSTTATEPSTVL
jgi:pteridine reductase